MKISAHFRRRGRPTGRPRMKASASALLTLLFCGGCAGAAKDIYHRLQDEDPAVRAKAAVEAAETRNEKALPLLVERLGDVEKDVRMMASVALEKLAGADTFKAMGWRFYDPPWERAKAVERWRQWLRQRGMTPAPASSQPSSMEDSVAPPAATRPASGPAATGPASSPAAGEGQRGKAP